MKKNLFLLLISLFSLTLLASIAYAATTIGTNITTDGNLTINGNTALEGDLTVKTNSLVIQDATGYTGIGTTTPAGRLAIAKGTADSQPMIVVDAPNNYAGRILDLKMASTSKLVVTSGGNLGLGTTTPVATLAIQSTQGQTADLFRVGTTSSGYLATTTDFSYIKVMAEGDTTIKGKVLNPEFLAEEQTGGTDGNLNGAVSVFVSGNYAYVANRDKNSLAIIDISNPADPVFVAEEVDDTLLAGPYSVFVSGNYAYMANFTRDSLAVIDISNPSDPVFVAEERGPTPGTSLDGAWSVFVSGNYAYVANNDRRSLAVIDISNPLDPVFVAEERGPTPDTSLSGARSVFVSGNYAYVANNGNDSLVVIDISNPADPVFVAEEQPGGTNGNLNGAGSVFVSGNYAYVTAQNRNSLAIIDISNPKDPVFVAEERGPTPDTSLAIARSVFVSGNYAYVANNSRDSLAVIDISNPAYPVFVAEERGPTPGTSLDGAISVFVSGNYAYVANLNRDSLAVIDVSGLTVSNAEIGSLKVTDLQVEAYAQFANGVSIQDALNVGRGAMFGGPVSISSPTSTIFAATTFTINQIGTGDILNLLDAGTEVLTVLDGGKVGIGTTTPAGRLAVAKGTTNSQPLIIADAPSGYTGRLLDLKVASTTQFVVTGAGKVGLGTSTPNKLLDIYSSGTTTMRFERPCIEMKSPNGTQYYIFVSNAGILTVGSGHCP